MKKLARTLLILSILVAALAEASLVENIINLKKSSKER